ncbi:molybdenum cofactor sulfurylase [Intrasporangium chromatireducens Q5-1]|uniref:Molybdenum cofactor sulfurylase n=1 Tax=Intrasporangium chromatireducens Q5-1 TaxID=584657 RepID=W9GKV4_9MICO|nr:xanthine dehydrogenase accessory protein XdhC [Intrasporangium chromatireducens]EWT05453.1 molybdenum cofactor sulfurylase [Intrasporangium chromatireducens Q5-1]
MNWLRAAQRLREQRRPAVVVTVTEVRGHAPREAGAKMVVTADDVHDTIGGGNLEASAVQRARELLEAGGTTPETLTFSLTDKAPTMHGRQCCGGEVSILLEPLPVVPAVAIFGVGHVGLELARILARHDIELYLVDSRADNVDPARLAVLDDAVARVHVHHAPVPEIVLGQVPSGTHVLVMTHDHAEDAALCDMALRCGHLGSIGLIGSSAKWRRFQGQLAAEGHSAEAVAQITTPIGLPDLTGKDPATIAVSVAAALLVAFQRERDSGAPTPARRPATRESRP